MQARIAIQEEDGEAMRNIIDDQMNTIKLLEKECRHLKSQLQNSHIEI